MEAPTNSHVPGGVSVRSWIVMLLVLFLLAVAVPATASQLEMGGTDCQISQTWDKRARIDCESVQAGYQARAKADCVNWPDQPTGWITSGTSISPPCQYDIRGVYMEVEPI